MKTFKNWMIGGLELNRHRHQAVVALVLVALLSMAIAPKVTAQPVNDAIIENVEVEATESGAIIQLQFRCGVRYITHFPAHMGNELRIRLKPEFVCVDSLYSFSRRGTLLAPGGRIVGLSKIDYEDDVGVGQYITLYFDQEVIYQVVSGSDFRSLSVVVYEFE